jgi:hypothetical protein
MQWTASQMICLPTSSATSPPGPCAAASVSVAPRITSSLTPITVRSFHRLLSSSSMAAGGRAIATSPVNGPPCPSCLPLQKVLVSYCCSGLILCWCARPIDYGASSMAAGGKTIATSPASPVNGPPCPSCLPPSKVLVLDWCSGLILCWRAGPDRLQCYVVCNPVTHKWHVVPRSIRSVGQARLDFDPMSSHFHVIEFIEVEGVCVGVEIYSSKIVVWIFKESEWCEGSIVLYSKSRSVFLNGFMHMVEYNS